jgi:S-adenosylmethionine decarboxylase
MDTRGRHVIAELDGCDPARLTDPAAIRSSLLEAARAAGATALADETFHFRNGGVSGFVLLAESHISIHTWPEHGYAAIDVYTCGLRAMPEVACRYLADCLGAERIRMSVLDRGLPTIDGGHEHHLIDGRGRAGASARAPSAA